MSTTIMIGLSSSTDQQLSSSSSLPSLSSSSSKPNPQIEIDTTKIKCTCCGLTEECTQNYIKRVQEIYHGKWICGLCAEAVNDETLRSSIGTEEAMNLHMSFCNKFRSSSLSSVNTKVHLINAMRQILRRSLDSSRGLRSAPSSPMRNDREIDVTKLSRCESCFSALSS